MLYHRWIYRNHYLHVQYMPYIPIKWIALWQVRGLINKFCNQIISAEDHSSYQWAVLNIDQRALLYWRSFATGTPDSGWSCVKTGPQVFFFHHDASGGPARTARHFLELLTNTFNSSNTHHTHQTFPLRLLVVPKTKRRLAGRPFHGSKTLLSLCIQNFEVFLLQSTVTAFRAGCIGCNDA